MKRIPEFNPRWAPGRRPAFTTTTELDGLVRAGMKRDALALARCLLKAPTVAAPTFGDALSAILTLADSVKPWKPLVEAAYERVPKRQRGSVRFWLMAIRESCHDYEGILQLAPKRFAGDYALLELLWAMGASFETNNKELIRKFAVRLPRAMDQAENPDTQAMLCLCLAEVCAREGAWDDTIATAEAAQECPAFLPEREGYGGGLEPFEHDSGNLPQAEDFFRIQNLNAYQLLPCADVESDLVREPNRATLVPALPQANVEGVNFGIVADLHSSALLQK
jgi:hypothetical protein